MKTVLAALVVAVALAAVVSPFASSSPDGLEKVAAEQGFADAGREDDAPAAGYAAPGVDDEKVATGLAGLAGTIAVFLLMTGVVVVVRRR